MLPEGGVLVHEPPTSIVWFFARPRMGHRKPDGFEVMVRPDAPLTGVNTWVESLNEPLTTPPTLNVQPAAETVATTLVRRAGETEPTSSPVMVTPQVPVGVTVVEPAIGLVQPLDVSEPRLPPLAPMARLAPGLTGAEAYKNYGRETAPIIARLGAGIVWRGNWQATLIGPGDEVWDEMFIARYPTAHAFLEMVTDPDYRKAVVHRQAAVETSRLIRTNPAKGGASFG